MAPWADILYGCDLKFWEQWPAARAFRGLKVSQDARACELWPSIRRVISEDGATLSLEPGCISQGGNSGFQAINLTAQLGVSVIILLGFDMSTANGTHWHGDHPAPMANPTALACDNWRERLGRVADQLGALGIRVVNATPGSALDCFERVTLQEAIDQCSISTGG